MDEEFLDIVDENNELTGESASRSKIHAEGLLHRTVHIYLFRKNGKQIEFLVHLRSPFKDLHPNNWDTRFGGHIKSGLTVEEGMQSEIKEEIGLDIAGLKLIEGDWHRGGTFPNQEFSKRYFLEYLGKEKNLTFDDGEVQEVRWMSIQEVKDFMTKNSEAWAPSIKDFTEISDYLLGKIS